jgi:uncharacterized YccA/Bax inhibitor family protein
MRTANPALNAGTFEGLDAAAADSRMTLQGTVTKTGILLLGVLLTAGFTWTMYYQNGIQAVYPWVMGGWVGGIVVAIGTVFRKEWAPFSAPVYALLQGLMLGGLSAMFEQWYPGIVPQAVGLTFGTLGTLLLVYTSRLIKPSENFKLGIASATGAIMLFYVVSIALSFFGVRVPLIHEATWLGIGFSIFVVIIAALNLVLDFDFIESGVERGAPKYMEWYASFGLLVTLVWLYIEILRLLAKLRAKD